MYGVKQASHWSGENALSSIKDVHIVATYMSASWYSVLLLPSSRMPISSSFMCSATICTFNSVVRANDSVASVQTKRAKD